MGLDLPPMPRYNCTGITTCPASFHLAACSASAPARAPSRCPPPVHLSSRAPSWRSILPASSPHSAASSICPVSYWILSRAMAARRCTLVEVASAPSSPSQSPLAVWHCHLLRLTSTARLRPPPWHLPPRNPPSAPPPSTRNPPPFPSPHP